MTWKQGPVTCTRQMGKKTKVYFFWRHINIEPPALWTTTQAMGKQKERKCHLKYCTKFISEVWFCLRPYSFVSIVPCSVILRLFLCRRADSTPCSTILLISQSLTHTLLPSFLPPLLFSLVNFLYRQNILLLNQINMGMHGIPHIRWKNMKNKIMYDLLAHIGVKGTERWNFPKWSFIFHKLRAGVGRFL